ncbi:hypothetical protein [Nioella nitratireducens]|uniref:hypothetical protein n=1 Tax=Nioella nitratireducens TaxID=1287720 RepID=UPI0008FD0095|nr:hypothetical protein [Nioella nitratireducens]
MFSRQILVVCVAALLGAAATVDRAEATCVAPGIASGRYENVDPNTRSITTANLQFVCGSRHIDNGDGTYTLIHDADPHWTLRLWGACHPSDCDWGTTRGQTDRVGRVLATYDQGFARRSVAVVPSRGNLVQLVVTSHYTDGRATRTWSEYLRLQ